LTSSFKTVARKKRDAITQKRNKINVTARLPRHKIAVEISGFTKNTAEVITATLTSTAKALLASKALLELVLRTLYPPKRYKIRRVARITARLSPPTFIGIA